MGWRWWEGTAYALKYLSFRSAEESDEGGEDELAAGSDCPAVASGESAGESGSAIVPGGELGGEGPEEAGEELINDTVAGMGDGSPIWASCIESTSWKRGTDREGG